MNFKSFALGYKELDLIEEYGFNQPTIIQERTLGSSLRGEDIIGISETGSGKTLAFLLPILNKIDLGKDSTQAIIFTPTRELAHQLKEELKYIQKTYSKLTFTSLLGGQDREREAGRLATNPHIIIGTPGKISDHLINDGNINYENIKQIVIDEIDMIVDFDFMPQVDAVVSTINHKKQLMVFSATLNQEIKVFLKKYMTNPTEVIIKRESATPTNVENILIFDKNRDRKSELSKLLKVINPYVCIIFASTKKEVIDIHKYLMSNGFDVGMIHGDLPPRKRNQVMKNLFNNKYQYVVASDIISRGIDLESVTHIISYNLPRELEYYIHRVGRTGRRSYEGEAYLLFNQKEEQQLIQLEKMGVEFVNKKIVDGMLRTSDDRVENKKKKENLNQRFEREAWSKVRKPKNVKPGYKVKMKKEMEKEKRKIKKAYFNELYKDPRNRR